MTERPDLDACIHYHQARGAVLRRAHPSGAQHDEPGAQHVLVAPGSQSTCQVCLLSISHMSTLTEHPLWRALELRTNLPGMPKPVFRQNLSPQRFPNSQCRGPCRMSHWGRSCQRQRKSDWTSAICHHHTGRVPNRFGTELSEPKVSERQERNLPNRNLTDHSKTGCISYFPPWHGASIPTLFRCILLLLL